MKPTPRELLNLLLSDSPRYLSGEFQIRNLLVPDEVVVSGSFFFHDGDYWDVLFDDGQREIVGPNTMIVMEPNGSVEQVFGPRNMPQRPPWSHVRPRASGLLGTNPTDDWQLDTSKPILVDELGLHATLINLEDPCWRASILVDQQFQVILRVDLIDEMQAITIDRSVSPEAAAKKLKAIKDLLFNT